MTPVPADGFGAWAAEVANVVEPWFVDVVQKEFERQMQVERDRVLRHVDETIDAARSLLGSDALIALRMLRDYITEGK